MSANKGTKRGAENDPPAFAAVIVLQCSRCLKLGKQVSCFMLYPEAYKYFSNQIMTFDLLLFQMNDELFNLGKCRPKCGPEAQRRTFFSFFLFLEFKVI